jgi:hypothetical protein
MPPLSTGFLKRLSPQHEGTCCELYVKAEREGYVYFHYGLLGEGTLHSSSTVAERYARRITVFSA